MAATPKIALAGVLLLAYATFNTWAARPPVSPPEAMGELPSGFWMDATGRYVGRVYPTNNEGRVILSFINDGLYILPEPAPAADELHPWSSAAKWPSFFGFFRYSTNPNCDPPYFVLDEPHRYPGTSALVSYDGFPDTDRTYPGETHLLILSPSAISITPACLLSRDASGNFTKERLDSAPQQPYYSVVRTYNLNALFPPPLRLH